MCKLGRLTDRSVKRYVHSAHARKHAPTPAYSRKTPTPPHTHLRPLKLDVEPQSLACHVGGLQCSCVAASAEDVWCLFPLWTPSPTRRRLLLVPHARNPTTTPTTPAERSMQPAAPIPVCGHSSTPAAHARWCRPTWAPPGDQCRPRAAHTPAQRNSFAQHRHHWLLHTLILACASTPTRTSAAPVRRCQCTHQAPWHHTRWGR